MWFRISCTTDEKPLLKACASGQLKAAKRALRLNTPIFHPRWIAALVAEHENTVDRPLENPFFFVEQGEVACGSQQYADCLEGNAECSTGEC